MNTELKLFNTNIMMSSLEISELTGKKHNHVIRDIDKIIKLLKPETVLGFKSSTYKDSTGKNNRMYELSEQATDILLDKYKGLNRVPHRLQEEAALKTIEQLLNITLIRQYKVLDYKIDGYCAKTNTCYEIDEPEHKYLWREDLERQKNIEKLLNCKFIRIRI
jgi:Rha family phage regulatory protein